MLIFAPVLDQCHVHFDNQIHHHTITAFLHHMVIKVRKGVHQKRTPVSMRQ